VCISLLFHTTCLAHLVLLYVRFMSVT
jgi:hypothetical protein